MRLIKLLKMEHTRTLLGLAHKNNFCPTVLHLCQEDKLPAKAFLLFSNAPGSAVYLLSHNSTGCYCCLQTIKHMTFVTNGPEGNSNL